MSMPEKELKRMTPEEYEAFLETTPETERYDYWDGVVLMSPSPSKWHQRVISRIIRLLFDSAIENGCYVSSEHDTWINGHSRCVKPDIKIECGENEDPVIVIEALSPSNSRYDLIDKLYAYKSDEHILEYWIVDTKTKTVIVHCFIDDMSAIYGAGETIVSKALPWISVDVGDIFLYVV